MKRYAYILFFGCSLIFTSAASPITIHQFESELIDYNVAVHSHNKKEALCLIDELIAEVDIQEDEATQTNSFLSSMYISRSYLMQNDFNQAAYATKHLIEILNNRYLTSNNKPLETLNLWLIYFQAIEIEHAVDDPMFDLLVWNEFKHLVCELQNQWIIFSSETYQSLLDSRPGIGFAKYTYYKTPVDECLENFIASLESNYQSDFQIPCDQLRHSLLNLIYIFKVPMAQLNTLNL